MTGSSGSEGRGCVLGIALAISVVACTLHGTAQAQSRPYDSLLAIDATVSAPAWAEARDASGAPVVITGDGLIAPRQVLKSETDAMAATEDERDRILFATSEAEVLDAIPDLPGDHAARLDSGVADPDRLTAESPSTALPR